MIIASIILDRERKKAANKAVREARREVYKLFNAQTKAYYNRMRAALDAGEDFTEPPPQFDEDDD